MKEKMKERMKERMKEINEKKERERERWMVWWAGVVVLNGDTWNVVRHFSNFENSLPNFVRLLGRRQKL